MYPLPIFSYLVNRFPGFLFMFLIDQIVIVVEVPTVPTLNSEGSLSGVEQKVRFAFTHFALDKVLNS